MIVEAILRYRVGQALAWEYSLSQSAHGKPEWQYHICKMMVRNTLSKSNTKALLTAEPSKEHLRSVV